nr:hypothetical protein [Tanacetum cinerariifolium]
VLQVVTSYVPGSSGPRRFFRYTMFLISCYSCYVMSLYPFTERYAQPYFFHVLIRQPKSHKDHSKNVNDNDDETEKGKNDEKKDDNDDDVNDNLLKVIVEDVMKEKDTLTYKNVITVHPTTSPSTTTPSYARLQHQLYLKMKKSLQDQADDPDDHDDHKKDGAALEGEKRAKRQKTSKNSKSARGSSSK